MMPNHSDKVRAKTRLTDSNPGLTVALEYELQKVDMGAGAGVITDWLVEGA